MLVRFNIDCAIGVSEFTAGDVMEVDDDIALVGLALGRCVTVDVLDEPEPAAPPAKPAAA
jgi:hypothetical protein